MDNLSELYVDTLKVGNLLAIDQNTISLTDVTLEGDTVIDTGGSLTINSPAAFTSGMIESMSYEYKVDLEDDPDEVGSPLYNAIAEIKLTKNMPENLFVKFVASATFYGGSTLTRNVFKIKLSFEAGDLRPLPGQVFNVSFTGAINDSATPTVLSFMAGSTVDIVPGEDYETTNTISYTDTDVTTLGVNIGSSPNWKYFKTNVKLLAYYDVTKIATDGLRLHILETRNTI